jgi:hypothetical protein
MNTRTAGELSAFSVMTKPQTRLGVLAVLPGLAHLGTRMPDPAKVAALFALDTRSAHPEDSGRAFKAVSLQLV